MKQYIVLIGIIFFLGSILWVNFYWGLSSALQQSFNPSEEEVIRASLQDPLSDTDQDGLANWEEDLYGTNKRNGDSDGDGIADVVEITRNSDPSAQYNYDNIAPPLQVVQEQLQSFVFSQKQPQIFSPPNVQHTRPTSIQTDQSRYKSTSDRQEINILAGIIQNTLVSTNQDLQVLDSFAQGKVDNIYPVEQLLRARQQSVIQHQQHIARLGTDHTIAGFHQQFVDIAQASITSLTVIIQQGFAGSLSTESTEAWQNYGQHQQQWVASIQDVHHWVVQQQLSLSPSDPGSIFLFRL